MTNHPQVEIAKHSLKVDEKLATLITKLWDCGIYTNLSCQENKPGICWIDFEGEDSAIMFLNVAHKLLMANPEVGYAIDVDSMTEDDVCFSANPFNLSEDIINDEVIEVGLPDYIFGISIRFPNRLIPELEKLF